MDDFDTFKASREKIDPSARKMSDRQWEQAYAAYQNARKRVGEGSRESGERSKKRRRSSSTSSSSGAASKSGSKRGNSRELHRSSNHSELGSLRHSVRGQSAYADLRLIVDIMAWVAIAVVVLAGVLTLFYYTSVPATLASLLGTCVQVIGIVVARLLVQVLIDIPDIALFRLQHESSMSSQAAIDSDET